LFLGGVKIYVRRTCAVFLLLFYFFARTVAPARARHALLRPSTSHHAAANQIVDTAIHHSFRIRMGDVTALAEAQAATNTFLMEMMRVLRNNQVDLLDAVRFFRYRTP
jgi:hypothetical protein